MGRFKSIPGEDTCAFYPIYDTIDMHHFAMILEDLGFIDDTKFIADSAKFVGISVSNEDKTYWYFEEEDPDEDELTEYDNALPDYLKRN